VLVDRISLYNAHHNKTAPVGAVLFLYTLNYMPNIRYKQKSPEQILGHFLVPDIENNIVVGFDYGHKFSRDNFG